MSRTSRRPASHRQTGVLLGTLLIGVAAACSDNAPTTDLAPIERSSFIDAYVDLRHVALRKPSRLLNASERDSVLAMHNVVEEDLRTFLEVHHTESEYMRDLWNEVEARISLMLDMAEGPPGVDGVGESNDRPRYAR